MDKAAIQKSHPHFPWLEASDREGVAAYLQKRCVLEPDEAVVQVTRAGDGNMNLTLRVATDRRSLILKQARPWVEKYDHIPAPWGRMRVEQKFYQRIEHIPFVSAHMPRLLHADPEGATVVLEDVGAGSDLTTLYRGDALTNDELAELGAYLAALHGATSGQAVPEFANHEMRELNHMHIYRLPYENENGLDLDAFERGLKTAAQGIAADSRAMSVIEATGARYLSTGRALVHGDFFPGSWLRTTQGVKVIDPEFGFYGDPEFDLGCALAHLAMAEQSPSLSAELIRQYIEGGGVPFDSAWIARYAACEVMRRLIGVAQLPLTLEEGARAKLLNRARQALLAEDWRQLWN